MSRTITPAQERYIRTLNQQLADLGVNSWGIISDAATTAEGSELIESLKSQVVAARTSSKPELVAEGIYRRAADGAMFRVQTSEQNRRYAKLLLPSGGWGYERGAIYTLVAAERLTLAQLEAWGLSTGVCAVCGRLLSTAASVARGIGPVCASRY